MFAIIETGGKQYKVSEGDKILVDLLETGDQKNVVFDSVLLISEGENTTIGQPTIKDATVEAEYLSEEKGKKLIVFKMRRRKDMKKKTGHRQKYAMVKINKINASGSAKPAKAQSAPKTDDTTNEE